MVHNVYRHPPMIKKLCSLLQETKQIVDRLPALDNINNYAELIQAVLQKELEEEHAKFDCMLALNDETLIKDHFKELCIARDKKNFGTRLHFIVNPENMCNKLYFDVACTLYPNDSFKVLALLFPSIKKIWVGALELATPTDAQFESQAKRRRPNTVVKLREIDILNAATDEDLKHLIIKFEHFKRFVIWKDNVFILDSVMSFNFKLHCELHQALTEKAPQLLRAIAKHNVSLAALYHDIERYLREGATIYNSVLPMLQVMSLSGERLGYGISATAEGNKAAENLVVYYHTLPEALQRAFSNCKDTTSKTTVAQVIDYIEKHGCIETAASELGAIIRNPANHLLLQSTPLISHEEKKALYHLYENMADGGRVTFDIALHTALVPASLSEYCYRKIMINNADQLVALLIAFQPTEYLEILRHTDLNAISFMDDLYSVVIALNLEQKRSLVMAIKDEPVREKLSLQASRLLTACLNTEDQEVISLLFEDYTEEQRVAFLKEQDSDGKTALHHILERDTGEDDEEEDNVPLEMLIKLYAGNNQLLSQVLKLTDRFNKLPLFSAALKPQLLLRLFNLYRTVYIKGVDKFAQDLLRQDQNGENALHCAASSPSIELIMDFFNRFMFNPKILLSETDNEGNTVLHSARLRPRSLYSLLNWYLDPNECVHALLKRNLDNETVLHPDMVDFYAILEDILYILISKFVSLDTLLLFLTTSMTNTSESLLNIMASNSSGIEILEKLIKDQPYLMTHIPIKIWIPENSETKVALICQLIKTREGFCFLRHLSLIKPEINAYLTPDNYTLWGGNLAALAAWEHDGQRPRTPYLFFAASSAPAQIPQLPTHQETENEEEDLTLDHK